MSLQVDILQPQEILQTRRVAICRADYAISCWITISE